MAQPKINALIWDKEDNTYYQKSVYFYTDLKELLTIIMLSDSNNNLHPEDIINFQEKFRQGKIKHCMVVKNHNGNKDDTPFQNIKDGGFLVRSRVTKDSLRDNYDVMSSSNRFGWRNNVTYCELSTPRDLNDNEKKIIEEALDQAMGITNQDKVFNLFALLCSAKDVVWKDHANSKHEGQGFYRDNRDRSFLGFTTMDLYHKEDVETRERVAKRIATCAWLLTKQLTGYELHLKDYPNDDFIEGLMAARYIQNENIIAKKVGEPTMTMKDLLKLATKKADVADGNIIAAQVCLGKIIAGTGTDHNRKLEDFLDMSGIKIIDAQPFTINVKWDDFKDVDNCLVWNDSGNPGHTFKVYIWDDLITTREMFDTDTQFIQVIKNK